MEFSYQGWAIQIEIDYPDHTERTIRGRSLCNECPPTTIYWTPEEAEVVAKKRREQLWTRPDGTQYIPDGLRYIVVRVIVRSPAVVA